MSGLIFPEALQLGLPAEIFWGAANSVFNEHTLPYQAGAIKSMCSIIPKRTPKDFKGDRPLVILKSRVLEEGGDIKIECAEMTVENLQRGLGYGLITDVAADPSAALPAHQIYCVWGNEGPKVIQLPYQNFSVFSVTTNDATPVPLTLTDDYTINMTTGEFTPVDGGAITSGNYGPHIGNLFEAENQKPSPSAAPQCSIPSRFSSTSSKTTISS